MENTTLTLQTQPSQAPKAPTKTPTNASTKPASTIALTLQSPSAAPVRVALFGVGRWGSHWLRKFLDHPQAELAAVVDPCESRLITLNRQYELEQQSITVTTDWQTALHLPNLDAVAIVTPAATHYPLIRAALEQGHHVLAEKPLTLDVAESLALCQLAAQQQRQLVIDHTYLFHAAVQRGRAVIQQGALGALRYGYAARTHLGPVRPDVDALWDLAIHDIAIFNSWLNATPIEVQAQASNWLQPGLADLVWVKLTYASGFQAFIHLCWSNPDKQRRLSVVGSQGTLVFDEMAASPLMLLQGSLEQQADCFIPTGHYHQAIEIEPIEPLQAVCTHFLTCVQENRASEISSGWLGAQLVQILAALTQSLQQGGKPITLNLV
nr:MAG: gfo/Idh/MocA family oxidoreductase [Leptolyngbya sp. IPPAS B-1204]